MPTTYDADTNCGQLASGVLKASSSPSCSIIIKGLLPFPSSHRAYMLSASSLYLSSLYLSSLYLSTNGGDMRGLLSVKGPSSRSFETGTCSEESDYTRPIDDNRDWDSDVTLVDALDSSEDEDLAWLLPTEAHSPEYYVQQLKIFNEHEYTAQDYSDGTTRLIDRMEEQWNE
jgi:hypothetical protein